MNLRQCHKCLKVLPVEEFYEKPRYICKVCSIAKAKAWRESHPAQYREYFRKYRRINQEQTNTNVRNYHKRIREQAIKAYDGKCACCGESDMRFLTIDHINGGGNKHRRLLRNGHHGGQTIYRFLINGGFPTGFQVLCYNCNCGKQYNSGICPHNN